MRRTFLLTLMSLALLCPGALAQYLHPCFDLDQNGQSDVLDLVMASNALVGSFTMPSGHGDIDGRDGFNLGDSRFYTLWLFAGGDQGTCPPHPPYAINPGVDTIFLGSTSIPAGDGQVQIPILLKSTQPTTDFLIPFEVTTTTGSVSIVDILPEDLTSQPFYNKEFLGASGTLFQSNILQEVNPGVHLLGTVVINYTGSTGGTVSLDTTSFSESRSPHYIFGDLQTGSGAYSQLTIAIPAISAGVNPDFPTMSVSNDSLYYETLAGYPDPDPQTFVIQTDGDLFSWSLTATPWLDVSPTFGVSGAAISVTPNIAGLGVGTHHGTIEILSTDAIGSPLVVHVYLKLKPQYPSFDANCDGNFSINDVVMQINYIFGSGELPCDPCTGEPQLKK